MKVSQLALVLFASFAFVAPLRAGADDDVEEFDLQLSFGARQTVATPEPSIRTKVQYQQFLGEGELRFGPLGVIGSMSLVNDGRYAEQQPWGGFIARLDSGGVLFDAAPLTLRVGRLVHSDALRSPYSLVISSVPHPIPSFDVGLKGDRFAYSAAWLGLNQNSRLPELAGTVGPIDRGATIRTVSYRHGRLRLGYQDVLVFAERFFDFEYLASPLPGFFLQYVRVASGSPWSEYGNDNWIMALFADYEFTDSSIMGQVLIDDFNWNSVANPESYQNPSKIAWAIGGTTRTAIGEFGLFHAGATKYTFQAFGGGGVGSATDTKYGYTYYSAVEFDLGSESRTIPVQENYVGYLHGENNLSFRLDHRIGLGSLDIGTDLEYTLTGSQSPANPWNEYNSWTDHDREGTRMLDDEVLESRMILKSRVLADLGKWSVFLEGVVGFVVNERALVDVPVELAGPNNEIRIFEPQTAPSRLIGGITIGASYSLKL